jgi:hypothetical protein
MDQQDDQQEVTHDTDDIRAALESAVDSTMDAPEPSETGAQEESAPEPDRYERDDSGRFAHKTAGETARAAHEGRVAESTQANSAAMAAPASWRAEAKEHWNSAPEAVRAEAMRRESDFNRAWQESAPVRQLGSEIQKVLAPYQEMIERAGSNPLQAISGLLDTRARLESADPMTRAQMGAMIVKEFGIDIALLDSALAGLPIPKPSADPSIMHEVNRLVEQKIAPVQQIAKTFEQYQRQVQEKREAAAMAEVEAFSRGREHMGNDDILETMADLIDVAGKRKFPITMEQAYEQACRLHPEIGKVMIARSTSSSALQLKQAAQRSRSAAVSVSGSPSGIASEQTPADDIRSHLEAAISQVER